MICGCVLAAGQEWGPARQVALRQDPVQTPAYTLNMICGSGMKSMTEGRSISRAVMPTWRSPAEWKI